MNFKNTGIELGSLLLDIEARQIINGNECIQVEPKLVDVLEYLFKNRNTVVSRDVLIAEVWRGQVISDNAISRSISQLRKLLSLSSQPGPIIETIPKVGYRLIVTAEPANTISSPERRELKGQLNEKKHRKNTQTGFDFSSLKVVLFVAFTGAIFVSYIWQETGSKKGPTEFTQTTLTHSPGMEKLAGFSPDGESIAFVHSEKGTGDEYLFLIDPVTGLTKKITQTPAYLLKLAWSPDSTKILYSSWKNIHERQCAINLIELDANKNLLSNEKLMDCSERALVNLAWNATGNKIYFNSRPSFDRPYSVRSYSFVSERITQLSLPPQRGNFRGDHFIVGNLVGSRIVVARYLSATELDLRVYDTKTDSVIFSSRFKENISGISWLGNSESLLLTIDNKLYRYDYLDEKRVAFYPISKDSFSFSTDSEGKRILFISSNIDLNLFSFDLETGQKLSQVTSDTSDEFMPSYANTNNRVAYLSNRSGKTQIWIRDENGGVIVKSDSPVPLAVTPLKWSPDDGSILFQHHDEIYLFDVSSQAIQRIIDNSHKAYVANWSFSGDSVFYSSEKSGEWQIWQYILSSGKHLQITFEGGYSANQHENGDLYFSKIHQSGIWVSAAEKLAKSGFSKPIKLFDEFEATNWISWQLVGNLLYYISTEEKGNGLFSYNIVDQTRQLVFPFDEKYLRYFSVKGKQVIFTLQENRESNIEILTAID